MARGYFRLTMAVLVCALLMLALVPAASARGPSEGALERIIQAQERHTERMMAIKGVVGMAAGSDAVIVLVKTSDTAKKIPKDLDGVPVDVKVSGEIRALEATDRYDRPVPIGVSTGHPDITAGTVGCRVTDGASVYALSNNHVYANENEAEIGDNILQPGPYDGGKEGSDPNVIDGDEIGTLADFEPIVFSRSRKTRNKIDAAIALCTTETLGEATLSGGYGTPESTIVSAEVGEQVMKYGRTTAQTYGQITGVNATVLVSYSSGVARFVDQVIVESTDAFIGGGDSGSLLVTDPGKNPVGLLFAGNGDGTLAIANRIDLVLERFGVTVDGAAVTDIAITEVSAPSPVVQGAVVDVSVTVKNLGNQDVTSDINVTLTDETDVFTIGTQTIGGGLPAGASSTRSFSWDTSSATLGDHSLTATHDFSDDDATNNSKSTVVTVTEEAVGATMHVAGIEMSTGSKVAGRNTFVWAIAAVTIVDGSGSPVEGATVSGHWENATTDSDTGTTDANGQVSLQSDQVKTPPSGTTFTFVVDSVAKDGWTYDSSANVETSDSITL